MAQTTEKIGPRDAWIVDETNRVVGIRKSGSPADSVFLLEQKNSLVAPGYTQTLKILGAAGQSVGAAYTFTSSWTVDGDYTAVRFLYANYGAATFTITAAKTAASPTWANNGTGLTWSNVTFDNSATAVCGDTWSGTAGSTTSYVVPVALSGTGANVVPKFVWSDWIAQTPVACTEAGSEDLRIIQHRVYSASTGYSVANSGTSASNWGDYNTNSRRKVYGQLTAGDQVSTINSVTPQSAWQWMMCIGVQAMLTKSIYNHGAFGDSITKAQGSFDNNNGLWGWTQRATQQLTDSGVGRHSIVNYACSGQGKAATWATFLSVISQGGLDTAFMFPWSPNDGISAGSAPWNLNSFRFHVSAFITTCNRYGVKPILCTQPPSVTITDAVSDLIRIANNAEIRLLASQGITVCDFDGVLSDQGAPARYLAGLTNSDNQHPSAQGHQLMANEAIRAIRRALAI